jgi:hypothetical protein
MDGSILSHTRRLATVLANELVDDPARELELWAATAQRREAMVVELYDSAAIERRLPKRSAEPELLPVVRKAIGGIWAQERSHTALVDSLRILDERRLTAALTLLGALEGRVAHRATADGWLAPIASSLVGLSRSAGLAPSFTKAFRALSPREFFRFSHELETTAKEGYSRILELLSVLDGSALSLGLTSHYEFAKTLAEECFHAAVFEQLDQWLEPDGVTFADVPARDAVARLRSLALQHLSVGAPSFGPAALAALPWTKSVHEVRVASHGGLGDLFEEFGVALPPAVVAGGEAA